MLVAYVSGHGFGHLTRLCEVLSAVRALDPAVPITVVGAVPEALVRGAISGPVRLRPVACDVGLVQRDALEIDEAATAARCADFDAGWDVRRDAEIAFLRAAGARLVLADVPPLPLEAAAEAGVPGVALSNFSWDWIYRHLARRWPGLHATADRAARACARAGLLLELPFAGGLDAFTHRERVGLVARRPALPREEARRRLGLDARPVALVSFGGVGLPGLAPGPLAAERDLRFLLPEELGGERLAALGLSYPDVVGAADVVVTKPGYGIVSDAIAARTRMVYTDRGDFPEYDVLVREMPRHLACLHLPSAEVRAGRIAGAVREALALPLPPPTRADGAARAAERILGLLS